MGCLKIQFVAQYLKKLKGEPLETLKNCRKKTRMRILKQYHSGEKLENGVNERGDPLH